MSNNNSRGVNFNPLVRTLTGNTAPLEEEFARKHTSDPRKQRYSTDHFQTREERHNAKYETAYGARPVQYPVRTIMNTRKNAEEKTGMRYNLGGGKRKSRGKRTKKGKKGNKKSANKRKSVKKGRKSRKSRKH